MASSQHDQFPSDMIFEVLARTCLQTLDSSKLVCKEWDSLTYDSKFLELLSTNTNTVSGYLVQSMVKCKYKFEFVLLHGKKSSNLSFRFLPAFDEIKIEAASAQCGLFVYVSRKNHRHDRYYICKPSTKQAVALPNPKTRYLTVKVALVVLGSNPLHYKIIRFSTPKRKFWNLRCEIFDSAIWAWKESADIVLPYGEMLIPYSPVIYASGWLYYLTNKDRVLAFDERSESYHLFRLPTHAFGNDEYASKRLVKYQGKLGLITCKPLPNGCFELCIMNKYENEYLWNKELALRSELLKENGYHFLEDFANRDVALLKNYDRMMFYNIKNCNMNEVPLNHIAQEVFTFRSDCETIDLKGGSRR